MAISASSVTPSNSLEEFRIEFNNLVTDVTGITSTNTFSTAIVFEGATADDYETTLTLTDPTADRTITLPNITGTVLVGTQANPDSADGAALGSASLEWSDLYLADSGVIYFGNDQDTTLTHTDGTGLTLNSTNKLTFGDAATFIHQSSDGVMTIDGEATIDLNASTAVLVSNDLKLNSDSAVLGFGADNDVTLTHTADTSLTLNLMMAATTFEPSGDTASGDNAAIGYTAAEGLILTGQGSTSDITFKNDADTTVFTIPTGTDDILFPDDAKILVGAGSDLAIYHDGSHSYIKDQGTGDLKLQGAADIVIEDTSGANAAVFNVDAGQELYWRGGSGAGKKFETTEAGATVTGALDVTTTIQGTTITAETAVVPDASDGAALGTTALEWSDLFLADGAVKKKSSISNVCQRNILIITKLDYSRITIKY